jgi:hypothetical protein
MLLFIYLFFSKTPKFAATRKPIKKKKTKRTEEQAQARREEVKIIVLFLLLHTFHRNRTPALPLGLT